MNPVAAFQVPTEGSISAAGTEKGNRLPDSQSNDSSVDAESFEELVFVELFTNPQITPAEVPAAVDKQLDFGELATTEETAENILSDLPIDGQAPDVALETGSVVPPDFPSLELNQAQQVVDAPAQAALKPVAQTSADAISGTHPEPPPAVPTVADASLPRDFSHTTEDNILTDSATVERPSVEHTALENTPASSGLPESDLPVERDVIRIVGGTTDPTARVALPEPAKQVPIVEGHSRPRPTPDDRPDLHLSAGSLEDSATTPEVAELLSQKAVAPEPSSGLPGRVNPLPADVAPRDETEFSSGQLPEAIETPSPGSDSWTPSMIATPPANPEPAPVVTVETVPLEAQMVSNDLGESTEASTVPSRLSVQLESQDMGKVWVHVSETVRGIRAEIVPGTEAGQRLIEPELPAVRGVLESSGLQMDDLSLNDRNMAGDSHRDRRAQHSAQQPSGGQSGGQSPTNWSESSHRLVPYRAPYQSQLNLLA